MVSPFESAWQAIFNKTQLDDGWVRKYALYHEPRMRLHSLHSWWCSDVSASVTWHITTISITFISGAHWLKPKSHSVLKMFLKHVVGSFFFHQSHFKFKSSVVIFMLNFWLSGFMLLFVAYLNSFFFGYFCNTTQIHVGVGGLNNSAVLSEHVCFQGALDKALYTSVMCKWWHENVFCCILHLCETNTLSH